MDTKIKININADSHEAKCQNAYEIISRDLSSLEKSLNYFLVQENLIENFGFSGLLELEVSLVSDSEIQKINNDYRNKDKPTDVISISLFSDFRTEWGENNLPLVNLGDIFISVDTAKKQSVESGIGFDRELIELLIHGVLHLLGFDHEISDEEMRIMYKKEQEIFDHYFENKA